MRRWLERIGMSATLVAATAAGAQTITAPTPRPADLAALRGYTLSPALIARFARVATALRAAEAHDETLAREDRTSIATAGPLDVSIRVLQAHPRLLSFYTREGLRARDAVLFPAVAMSAKIAAMSPDMAALQPVTAAQVAFYRAHQPAIDAILIPDDRP